MSLLKINDLSVTFRQPAGEVAAVKNVSLAIEKGEMLALVGESGSGKSLTALSVMQLLPPSARCTGNVRFEGEELVGKGESVLRAIRGSRIGMVFQEPMTALNPLHTIGRQIGETIPARVAGSGIKKEPDPAIRRGYITALLDQVGLAHFKDRLDAYPHQLSGGERQRVMIAMAIANRPALLIADEPTTAVDVTIQAKILELLKKLQKDLGMAMLFITHDLTLVRRLADRVAIMQRGELAESGRVADVFTAPKHPYTQRLLASEPKGAPLPVSADAQEVITCEDLRVHFPIKKGVFGGIKGHVKAVDGITLTLRAGETLGIVGESGSGKTTLGFALLRLIKSRGRVVFLGRDVHTLKTNALRPLRRRMQVVFQDPYGSLNPRMSVRQIVEEGLLVHEPSLGEAGRMQRVDVILQEVGLSPEMKDRYPHEFSGGQRQRISIARAMVPQPRLVVLDEPTSALDLTVQSQILALLKELQRKHGLSYLFISHDLRVVRAIAHRIAVLYRGRVVEEGEAGAVLGSPREEYTQALIAAAFLEGHGHVV